MAPRGRKSGDREGTGRADEADTEPPEVDPGQSGDGDSADGDSGDGPSDGTESAMTLAELSDATGIPPRTIRYYQAEKLLQKPNRDRSDARVARYTSDHLERLHLVTELRDRGLKLPAIRALIEEGDASSSVADWLGLDDSLRGSWGHDEPDRKSVV